MPSAACLNCDRTFVCDQHLEIHRDFIHCVYSDTQCKECRRVLSTRRHLQIHIDFCHPSYVNSNIEPEEISEDELIPDYDDYCSTSSEEPPKKCIKSNRQNAKKLLIDTSKAQPNVCNKPNTGKNKAKKGPRKTSEAPPKGYKGPNKNDAEIVSVTSGSPTSKNSNNSEKFLENTFGPEVKNDEDAEANFDGIQGHKRKYCKLCGYSIKANQGRGRLDKHMLKEHGIPISCGICKLVCNSRVLLKQHERIAHADVLEEQKVCSHCGKTYSNKGNLRYHIRKVHSADVVEEQVCSHCGKTFSKKWNLQEHIRHVHSKEKRPKRVCPVCGVETGAYQQHMRLHSGDKPYSCNVCGLKFRVSQSLTRHQVVHQEIKQFQCELCGKSYRLYKALDDHKRASHFGEERFKCNICGRSFKWRKSLKIHKNSHQIIPLSQPEQQTRTSYSEPDKTAAQTNYVNNQHQQYHSAMFWGLNPGTF